METKESEVYLVLIMSKYCRHKLYQKKTEHNRPTPTHSDRKPKESFQILFLAAFLVRLPFSTALKVGSPG